MKNAGYLIQIDASRPVPIYLQIAEQVKLLVATGQLEAGEKLPSVRELAQQLVINPNTVAHALNELEHGGIIETRRGRGTFIQAEAGDRVTAAVRDNWRGELANLLAQALSAGLVPQEIKSLVNQELNQLINRKGDSDADRD